jgi:transcriptional regulator with XRE-family HTH domain
VLYSPAMNADFAPLLRMSRSYRGLSRREVAKRAGLHIVRIFRLENGIAPGPNPDELRRLAKVLQRPELAALAERLAVADREAGRTP